MDGTGHNRFLKEHSGFLDFMRQEVVFYFLDIFVCKLPKKVE